MPADSTPRRKGSSLLPSLSRMAATTIAVAAVFVGSASGFGTRSRRSAASFSFIRTSPPSPRAVWPSSPLASKVESSTSLFGSSGEGFGGKGGGEVGEGGDPLRASTGVRPSLHPIVINCVAEALSIRTKSRTIASSALPPMETSSSDGGASPLEVAIAAGVLAYEALERRRAGCEADGDDAGQYTQEESQTVSGRVVGVVTRLGVLEAELAERVAGVAWVAKYREEGSFGLLREEVAAAVAKADGEGGGGGDGYEDALSSRIEDDPLFRMNRAECLLALFIRTVEAPQLKGLGLELPGGGEIDFIDADRLEALLGK